MSNPWILCPKPNPTAKFRLFCFPCAGGLPSSFNAWSRHLWPTFEVCTLQLPGRGQRIQEPSIRDISILVQEVVLALKNELARPFIFLGHSFGALLSFEVIHQLSQQNYPIPKSFFVCSCGSPNRQPSPPFIHNLPDPMFTKELSERYQAIPDIIQKYPEFLSLFLPSLRADFALFETYTYQPKMPLRCPINVLAGWQDSAISLKELWNWQKETDKDFNLYLVQGDHFFLHQNFSTLQSLLIDNV
ncbi:MAG: thioesterase II family protein [Microcystaceae cyanobacterium]